MRSNHAYIAGLGSRGSMALAGFIIVEEWNPSPRNDNLALGSNKQSISNVARYEAFCH